MLIKWPLSSDLKEVREQAVQTAGAKISRQGIGSTKALTQKRAEHIEGY